MGLPPALIIVPNEGLSRTSMVLIMALLFGVHCEIVWGWLFSGICVERV